MELPDYPLPSSNLVTLGSVLRMPADGYGKRFRSIVAEAELDSLFEKIGWRA